MLLGKSMPKRAPRADGRARARAGVLGADGLVACHCKACRAGPAGAAGARVSCSDFEEHAGSRERRPAESTFLAALGLSLRVRPRAPAVLSGGRERAGAACPVAACPAARRCAAAHARQGAQSPVSLWRASGSGLAGLAAASAPLTRALERMLPPSAASACSALQRA
jgi:hypothetical protein